MAASPVLRPVACVAALNASVQGVVGVVLSVLALCVCFCAIGTIQAQSGNDFGQYLTYYLQGEECGGQDFHLYSGLTSPMALRVWMALSLFFSASMMISSIVLVVGVSKKWSDEKLQITLVSWLFINTFTAVDDVILGYVFGNDYRISQESSSQPDHMGPFTLALISFVAVRGIYLWLLNLAFIVYLFGGARQLHKHLNEQIPSHDQEPIESWPTLDDFGKTKGVDIERTPPAVNTRLAQRVDNSQAVYPEYTAMARWPNLNGQAQTMRESRPERAAEDKDRRSKTVREQNNRGGGVDNPSYESENRYFLRLPSEPGSTRDYEDMSPENGKSSQQGRSKRETADTTYGLYKQKTDDPWREKRNPSPPSAQFMEENGIPIPPVDYLDTQEEPSTPGGDRPLSLQEAILDRTLRLKKVPDELKKGFKKY